MTTAAPWTSPSRADGAGLPRVWTLGGRRLRVVGPPSLRDPRLHLSVVTLTILLIGQLWLGFQVSVPQIGAALVTCAVIEVVMTYRRSSVLVWPASALQTATSVALIFRAIGTESGDRWTFHGWYLFAGVAALSLATKYVIRFGGAHVFNPSNVGLVLAFLVLGSERVEPLDLWWAPLGWAMLLAYAVIVVGGVTIAGRLGLLTMGAAFWVALAAGTGVLAASGHCITARWSFTPVCGLHFWWIIVTSPEILVFLFFMITDPKTVPSGRVARMVFGVAVGVVSTFLLAPWGTEFGAKVGLLSGLVLVCATRPVWERRLPVPGSVDDEIGPWLRRAFSGGATGGAAGALLRRGVVIAMVVAGLGLAVVGAGTPARATGDPVAAVEALPTITGTDPADLPQVTVDPRVAGLSAHLATPEGAQELARSLALNLDVEAEALAAGDASLLPAVDDGERLLEMEAMIADAGEVTIPTYSFDSLHLVVVFPGGLQRGANAGLVSVGTVEDVSYGPTGEELQRVRRPFSLTFSLRQTTSGRWLTTDTLASPER